MIDHKRLNFYLEEKKISTKQLAEVLEITHSAVSLIRNGKNQMSASTFAKLIDAFPDLCPKWLMTGMGSSTCAANLLTGNNEQDSVKDKEIKMLRELLASKEMNIDLLSKMNVHLNQQLNLKSND